jgi:hypothetical protein
MESDRGLRQDRKEKTVSHEKRQSNSTLNKKRSRKTRKRNVDGEECSYPKKDEGQNGGAHKPLQGLTIAVSTLVAAADKNERELGPTGGSKERNNYKCLVQLCQKAGAQTTGQVHSRVDCVVATEHAIRDATQRVRKAWKKGIPVVHVAWVERCCKENRRLPMKGSYVFETPASDSSIVTTAASTSQKGIERDGGARKRRKTGKEQVSTPIEEAPSVKTVQLGCCCACHENGDTDCPWCVSCPTR